MFVATGPNLKTAWWGSGRGKFGCDRGVYAIVKLRKSC